MPEGENASPLETLRARLYANDPVSEVAPESLRRKRVARFFGWQASPAPLPGAAAHPRMPFALKFLFGAIAFFVLAGAAAAGVVIFGGRSISTTHVAVVVDAPPAIASGDTVSLVITVHNQNPVAIQNANLTVDLPAGTRAPDNPTQPLAHYADTLGSIPSGASATRTVRAVIFGAENQQLTIPVHLQYQTNGSNATSVKEASHALTVTTSPISINVASVPEIASGQPLSVTVTVRSNAATPLDNVAVAGAYPPGFTFTSSAPAPASGSYFLLGTLAPGESKTITVTGTMAGQEQDQRVFRFTVGTGASDGSPAVAVPYTSNQTLVTIAKPFLGITLSVNHQSADSIVVPSDSPIQGLLSWKNSLDTPITDAQVVVRFGGNAFDPKAVSTQNGFYTSNNSTLFFTKDTVPTLALLQPQDSGTGTFTFVPKLAGVRSPTVTMAITVSGRRAGTGGGTVASTINRTILVGANVALTTQVTRASMPFVNSGPIPPQVDKESTYTIALSASTPLNPVGGSSVSMQLPAYVRYTGQASTASTAITYDAGTRTVTWNIGDLTPGTPVSAAFQVALLPSISQKGTSPILVGVQSFAGKDKFTMSPVAGSAPALVSGTVQ